MKEIKFRIQRKHDNAYMQIVEGEHGTILFSKLEAMGTIFEETKQYAEGMCYGLEVSTGDAFIVKPIIHVQNPSVT